MLMAFHFVRYVRGLCGLGRVIASLTFFLYYLIFLSKKQVFFISSMIPVT
tara:strand:+ start:435 stop:584 length:150 start_codon:yes stop_codon:yes gene_type:complete